MPVIHDPATRSRLLPILGWLPSYRPRTDGPADLTAGFTVAVMLIPQAMAYASLAGLPPVVGLYASVFPILAYALFGSSRPLAVGPVAMDSLLVAAGVGALVASGSEDYLRLATVLAGMVGVLHVLFALTGAHRLTRLLTPPVIAGFTSGAAILIALSQLKHMLGIDLPRSARLHEHLASVVPRLLETHGWTIAIGAGSLALLVALKRMAPRFPRALLVVALASLLAWGLDLGAAGLALVGHVPAGLPSPTFTLASAAELLDLLPTAIAIALVAVVEAFSVAEVFARRAGESISPPRELVGLGAANLVAFLFGGYPITGGLSRTAVNAGAGARTPLAGVVTAAVIALALLFFTALFTHLPLAVLAAIVMSAVGGLIDREKLPTYWRTHRPHALVLMVTALTTLFVGIVPGIGVGVALGWVADKLRPPPLEVLSVDAEALEPAPQRGPADAEAGRGAAHVPAVALEGVDQSATLG